jgi:hypothetical protein
MQSKKHSLLEQTCSIITGFVLSWLLWKYPITEAFNQGWLSPNDAFLITLIFTVFSFARGYTWRRIFNART